MNNDEWVDIDDEWQDLPDETPIKRRSNLLGSIVKRAITPLIPSELLGTAAEISPVKAIATPEINIGRFKIPSVDAMIPLPNVLPPQLTLEPTKRMLSQETSPLNLASTALGLRALRSPVKLVGRARKLTTEILQPPKNELASYLARSKQLPAVEQTMPIITKSKTYGELKNNIDKVIKNSFARRNEILKQNNYRVNAKYLQPLEELITITKKSGQVTPSEIKQMEDVLLREKIFFTKNRGLDRIRAQERKEYLQKLTRQLLERKAGGETTITEPARKQALDALRKGLKDIIEGSDTEVSKINATYEGLLDAKELVAGQEALAQKAVPENIIQRVARIFTRPQDIPAEVARTSLGREASLARKTGKIKSLVKQGERLSKEPFYRIPKAPIRQ